MQATQERDKLRVEADDACLVRCLLAFLLHEGLGLAPYFLDRVFYLRRLDATILYKRLERYFRDIAAEWVER